MSSLGRKCACLMLLLFGGILSFHGSLAAQERPQKPVVAAATIIIRLLRWDGEVDIEMSDERTASVVAKNPELRAKGGIPLRQISDCKFEFAGPGGIRLDFGHLSNEYAYESRSTGLTLVFKGTSDGSPMCYEKSCYRDLKIDGSSRQLQRMVRAVEFISANSCPLRRLPF